MLGGRRPNTGARVVRDPLPTPMRSLPLVAIRRRAAVALLLLTALTGGSYAVLQLDQSRQDAESKVVSVTARQQMLSQRIALLVQALSGTLTPGQHHSAQQRL